LNAVGESESEVKERHRIAAKGEQQQRIEEVDHLGIEDVPDKR